MRNLKLWKAAIGILVLAALCVCLLPWPSRIDMTVPSQKVAEDGTILEDGQIVLKGWKLNYLLRQDKVKFSEVKPTPLTTRLTNIPQTASWAPMTSWIISRTTSALIWRLLRRQQAETRLFGR